MSQNPGSEEAVRWKKKFLDALEDNEKRERSLLTRVRLLRRGLLGVSLAGDGLDPELDLELGRLRKALRNEDSEAGLEVLLEQIERSVLRLDHAKTSSIASLERALSDSAEQLERAAQSRALKKTLRRFARALPTQIADVRNHTPLLIEFLSLLRELVRELAFIPDAPEEVPGFWRRLLFGHPAARPKTTVSPTHEPDPVAPGAPVAEESPLLREDPEGQPGFAFIARHVEPVLLRILDNIQLPEDSAELARSIRDRVSDGLNWYDFAAVLEDIAAIIARTIDRERSEFQGFLNQINTGLEQVHQYVQASSEHSRDSREAESELDELVRTGVSSLSESVNDANHLDELKQAVQGQLDTILLAVDSFQETRRDQNAKLEQQTQKLSDRLAVLEQEASVLRGHLASQQSQAARDALTELPNRGAYDRMLRDALAVKGDSFCLAIADVDRFKSINDSFGHLAGDKVLRILAREIASRVRQTDLVARYGGEEFVIVMPDTDSRNAMVVLETVRTAISGIPFHFKERQVQITMSFGVAAAQSGDSAESLFERADQAMYLAKQAGRNRCVLAGATRE